ncbi:hypothetical protein BGZ98_002461 [Dissophora globulifera]|nr:hypothetical protein BGZ98_002461 [Dissophora globulifera]
MDQSSYGNQGLSTRSRESAVGLSTSAQPPIDQQNPTKKTAFKDMLRQRQTALRNQRASSASLSDTRSRRSAATTGYPGYRDYYPSNTEYFEEQPQWTSHERGISLQSLREEAAAQSRRRDPLPMEGIVLRGPDPRFSNEQSDDPSSGAGIHTHYSQNQSEDQDRRREDRFSPRFNGTSGQDGMDNNGGSDIVFKGLTSETAQLTSPRSIELVSNIFSATVNGVQSNDELGGSILFRSQERRSEATAGTNTSTFVPVDVRTPTTDRSSLPRVPMMPYTKIATPSKLEPTQLAAFEDTRVNTATDASPSTYPSIKMTVLNTAAGNSPGHPMSGSQQSTQPRTPVVMNIATPAPSSSSKGSTPLPSPSAQSLPSKPAVEATVETGSENALGIRLQEERLKQKVAALVASRRGEIVNNVGSKRNADRNNENEDSNQNGPSSPVALSTFKKSYPESDNNDQQPFKRVKKASGESSEITGLSLNAIRGERAAPVSTAGSATSGSKQPTTVTPKEAVTTPAPQPSRSTDPRLNRRSELDRDKDRSRQARTGTEGDRPSEVIRSQDRTTIPTPDRAADRGPDRGYDNRGYDRGGDRLNDQVANRSSRDMYRDYDRGYDRGYDRQDRGGDWPNYRNSDRGADRIGDRVNDRGGGRPVDRGFERLPDRSVEKLSERGGERGSDRGSDKDDRGQNRHQGRKPDDNVDKQSSASSDRSVVKAREREPEVDQNVNRVKTVQQGGGSQNERETPKAVSKSEATITVGQTTELDDSPILFSAANRMQSKSDAARTVEQPPLSKTEPTDGDEPIIFSSANRLQQHQQQQQQQQQLQHTGDSALGQQDGRMADSNATTEPPILFSSASRNQQNTNQPMFFSSANRIGNLSSPSASTFAASFSPTALSGQGVGSLALGGFGTPDRSQDLPFFNSNGLNMVPTAQGEIGRSDMSLAFEVIDRCTVDLQQLQQRYAAITVQLNDVTSKALDSGARIAHLEAQLELERKMRDIQHEMRCGLEQQQLPELQRMMLATKELISRLSQLSTSAAAGSATAVVIAPKMRQPNTATGSSTGSGAEPGTRSGSGAGSGSGTGAGSANGVTNMEIDTSTSKALELHGSQRRTNTARATEAGAGAERGEETVLPTVRDV